METIAWTTPRVVFATRCRARGVWAISEDHQLNERLGAFLASTGRH